MRTTIETADGWTASCSVDEDSPDRRIVVDITDPDGHWAGRGVWRGQIEDCAADLGDEVYDRLDAALATSIDRERSASDEVLFAG